MRFFYAGQSSFSNRGCEALVRATSAIVRSHYSDATFYTPSVNPDLDEKQWPESGASGIDFLQAPEFPRKLRAWNWCRRALPVIEKLGRPSCRLSRPVLDAMMKADYAIMTGGDNISLDYDLPSLYHHAAFIDNAKRLGKRTVLWAASVGPFNAKPHIESLMKAHLADYDFITVRESDSLAYLRRIGVERASLVVDPAFVLTPQAFDTAPILPESPEGLIGINVSPLIRKFRGTASSMQALDAEIAAFVRELIERSGYGIMLLPHVVPLDGGSRNSDYHYMKGLVQAHGLAHRRVTLVLPNLNAPQLKFLISKCRFFIGARTHATIAAFSTGVPTISISYSVKSKGMSKDLFEDDRVVLETPSVSKASLIASLGFLERNEHHFRQLLAERIPTWKERAYMPVHEIAARERAA